MEPCEFCKNVSKVGGHTCPMCKLTVCDCKYNGLCSSMRQYALSAIKERSGERVYKEGYETARLEGKRVGIAH